MYTFKFSYAYKWIIAGKVKDRVFPDPVSAIPIKSYPFSDIDHAILFY